MIIKELIADLMKYDPEEEIAVAYWDKDLVSEINDVEVRDAVWSETVSRFESGEWHWQSSANECLVDLIREAIEDSTN